MESGFKRQLPTPCWKILKCENVKCAAKTIPDIPCWRLSDTCCNGHCKPFYANNWERCLACPVFGAHLESDPRGSSRFLIDELKHLTRSLCQQAHDKAENLLQILNNLPDGLFTMDKMGKITYFNAAAEKITGLSAQDAIGMHCKDIFQTTTCETECTPQKAPEGEKNLYNQEFLVTRLDGKTISIISSISVLKDPQGNVIGGMEVFKDISERKRLEDELRLSESKYRRIFEGSKDMIFISSRDGIFKDVNQAGVDMLGYGSKQELLSLSSVEKIYSNPIHRKVFQKEIERQGFVKDFEVRFKKKDGTRIHCLVSGNAIRGANGDIIGYEGIIKDITARMDAVRDMHQRHRELSLLNSVALAMNKTQNLDETLMTALKRALDVLNLNSGCIFLIDQENRDFLLSVHQNMPVSRNDQGYQVVLQDDALMQALLSESLSLSPKPTFPPFKAILQRNDGADAIDLTCFLITAKEKASGFIAMVIPSKREFTDQDFGLLGSLGNFLGGAIENTDLLQTIKKHREELKDLTAQLFHSQELERQRIARELHDEAGQALTGINFSLETIAKHLAPQDGIAKELIADTKKQINRTYQEMRRISYRLHPALLSDLGLEPALDSYLASICRHCKLNIDFKMVGFEERVDADIETVLYRLSQEALTNTLKHAQAKNFRLSIIKSYPNIIFLAQDDGVGFDLNDLDDRKSALGLLSMRERAAMLGGNFSLRTAPGKGTRIRIEISIKERHYEC